MTICLAAILLVLMIFVGGKRGAKTFCALYMNIFLLVFTVFLIACGVPAIPATLVGCIIISVVTLFFINGTNKKTINAFFAILTVLVIMTAVIFIIGANSHIEGFADENTDEICWYSTDIGLDMVDVAISMILMGLIGAIIDTAIAITSALNEVYENNTHLTVKELFLSGMSIGRDILGTTTNTLFFAYLGGFMTLIIWFEAYDYSIWEIINSKVFCQQFLQIMCSGLGCVLIIPVASFFMAKSLKKPAKQQ